MYGLSVPRIMHLHAQKTKENAVDEAAALTPHEQSAPPEVPASATPVQHLSIVDAPHSSSTGAATVSYNNEFPVPGVIIKQDEIFVEGISFSGIKKCSVSLRVAKAGHVSLLFHRAKHALLAGGDVLMGGFVLKRHVNSEDCASCSLTKNPRGAYDFCLRCDFPGLRTQPRFRASVSCIFTQALSCRGSSNFYRGLGNEIKPQNCSVLLPNRSTSPLA